MPAFFLRSAFHSLSSRIARSIPPSSFIILPFKVTLLTLTVFAAFALPAFAKEKKAPPGSIVKWKEIPAAVQTAIQTGAAGGKVNEVQKIAINGVFIYCAEVKGADGKWTKVYSTDAGTLMKTEPDNARNKRKHKPLFG